MCDSDEYVDVEDIGTSNEKEVMLSTLLQSELQQKSSTKHQHDIILDSVDSESRKVIERMLEEERLYASGKPMKVSPAPRLQLPTNRNKGKCRWTSEEIGLYHSGVEIFGENSYAEIADLIQTKSVSQVQAYAKRLRQREKEAASNIAIVVPSHSASVADVTQTGRPTVHVPDTTAIHRRKRRAKLRKKMNIAPKVSVSSYGIVAKIEYDEDENEIVDVVDEEENLSSDVIKFTDELGENDREQESCETNVNGVAQSNTSKNLVDNSSGTNDFGASKAVSDDSHTSRSDSSLFVKNAKCFIIGGIEKGSEKSEIINTLPTLQSVGVPVNESVNNYAELSPLPNGKVADQGTSGGDVQVDDLASSTVEETVTNEINKKSESENISSIASTSSDANSKPWEIAEGDGDQGKHFESSGPKSVECNGGIPVPVLLDSVDCRNDTNIVDAHGETYSIVKTNYSNIDSSYRINQIGGVKTHPGLIENSKLNAKIMVEDHLPNDSRGSRFYLQNGGCVFLPLPSAERVLDPAAMEDDEKRVFTMFLDIHSSKNRSPKDYLKIRNHLVGIWQASRPSYANKATSRIGLGYDVIIVGKIHSFLERVGAINFGCDEVCYNASAGWIVDPFKLRKRKTSDLMSADLRTWSNISRKRKIRLACGHWQMPEDGRKCASCEDKKLSGRSNAQKDFKSRRKASTKYDPFTLVRCREFVSNGVMNSRQAYRVEFACSALATVVYHSLLCTTEVIGMLGGRYCTNTRTLSVVMAEPCESSSTEMQCEMDPVSQADAMNAIQDASMSIVGWYHSHPKFRPDPSVRDLETQLFMQEYLATTGSPFIGVITQSLNVERPITRCLTIVNNATSSSGHGLPYRLDYTLSLTEPMPYKNLLEKLNNLTLTSTAKILPTDFKFIRENFVRVMENDMLQMLAERYSESRSIIDSLVAKMNSCQLESKFTDDIVEELCQEENA